MSHTPPLTAIEALVVLQETGSFRSAADRLAISPSAMSRRIQLLETSLGGAVLVRGGRALRLTALGERYLAAVASPFLEIATAGRAIRSAREKPLLRMMAPHSLAAGWLLPVLGEIGASAPSFDIDLAIGRTGEDFDRQGADIAIRAVPTASADRPERVLVDIEAAPMAAPGWADAHVSATDLPAIFAAPRVAVSDPAQTWQTWAQAAGFRGDIGRPMRTYETLMLAHEAGAAGLGVALGVVLHANRFLRHGRLCPVAGIRAPTAWRYTLAFNPRLSTAQRRRADAIGDHLCTKAAQDANEFARAAVIGPRPQRAN